MAKKAKEIRARTEIPTDECTFKWVIENVEFYICKVGDKLISPMFTNGPSFLTTWHLIMYPNGREEDKSEGIIGIFLERTSSDTSAHFAIFRLSLLGYNNKEHNTLSFKHLYEGPVSSCGSIYFIERKTLFGEKKYTWVSNDTLVVVCVLKTARLEDDLLSEVDGMLSTSTKTTAVSTLESLSNDFRILFNNEKYSDLVLKTGDESLFVHKCILSVRSSVFANMFKHDMKENLTNCLEINDLDPAVVKAMINYMYCGQIDDVNPEMAIRLYSAAEKYDLQELKRICAHFIVSHLTKENVCEALLLGDLYKDSELISATKNFIYMNCSKIQVTENWLNFAREKPDMALELNTDIIMNRRK